MTEIYLRLVDLILTPVILLMLAILLFLRGHDLPGGGFIAGLLVAAALELTILARGAIATRQGAGPLAAAAGGERTADSRHRGADRAVWRRLLSRACGPSSTWATYEIKIGTPQLFDLGVMLVVVGMAVTYLLNLSEQPKADGRRRRSAMTAIHAGGAGRRAVCLRRLHGPAARPDQAGAGAGLFTHAVNLALFGTGALTHGAPPILPHEGDLQQILATRTFADPLPQALILTAIVISFGVTAFIVVLIYRRDALTGSDLAPGELARSSTRPTRLRPGRSNAWSCPRHADDYDIFQYELDEVYDGAHEEPKELDP